MNEPSNRAGIEMTDNVFGMTNFAKLKSSPELRDKLNRLINQSGERATFAEAENQRSIVRGAAIMSDLGEHMFNMTCRLIREILPSRRNYYVTKQLNQVGILPTVDSNARLQKLIAILAHFNTRALRR